MRYMTKTAFNPHHTFALLDCGVNIRKPQLIDACIKQTHDYRTWEADRPRREREELRKSEAAFEAVFYKGEVIA